MRPVHHFALRWLLAVGGASLISAAPSGPAAAPFHADWDSLRGYDCPDWFRDAKFGLYAHWGVFSAAQGTRNTDWYGRNMYAKGHPNRVEHEARHGPVATFGYKDLVPRFTGEKFNADEWADLFVAAGARFAGPMGEHADGFSLWASAVNPWNAAAMGPRRDIVGEMEQAIRRRGLKFLVSLHHQWHWGWFPTWDRDTDASDPRYASLYGPAVPATARGVKTPRPAGDAAMTVDPLPPPAWQQTWLAKVKEVVDGYSPDLLWFDNRMQILSEAIRQDMAAYFYNHARARGQEPVLTFKRPDLPLGTGTVDLERARMPDIYPEPWLTDTSVSRSSWAWAKDLELYPTDRLVDDLVDIVSKNGCLLLNLAPAPDGTIPADQQERLRGIGAWLRINGEAIYGSRPWLVFGEGPTQTPVGHLADVHFDGFTSGDIRFTTNRGFLYAIALGWPAEGNTLTIATLATTRAADEITEVSLLGHSGKLAWTRTAAGLQIELPAARPCDHAFTFKISRGTGR
jgi:alpha-L-fucosidase